MPDRARVSQPPIERLQANHSRTDFRSGAPELDRYLHELATQDVRRRIAAVFVALEGEAIVGYYTLSSSTIELPALPHEIVRRLPRHPLVPATLLCRLAVHEPWQGRRLGENLLMDALIRSLRSEVASFAVVVDARDERAARFYERYEFAPLVGASRRLFLPMATIARLVQP